jgi:glutaredoxin
MRIFKNLSFAASLATIIILTASFCASGTEYSVGSGSDGWWTSYPEQSENPGKEVNHPQWVLDALKDKPVVIYVHKGCDYCKPQTDAMAEVVNESGDDFAYYDIAGDGSDARAEEALLAYDPNGGVSYVPLTVILTLAPDSEGNVQVAWHSTEDVTGKEWIENYVKDSISYYDDNSADWKK